MQIAITRPVVVISHSKSEYDMEILQSHTDGIKCEHEETFYSNHAAQTQEG